MRASFREKGSKFIGVLFPISSLQVFEKSLRDIASEYPDATHHCYAWRLNPDGIEEFAQDDGEPSGTAGLPILNRLKSYEVVNGACVVVRYYGGTKFGKSGLIEAYGRSAELCLQKATLQTIVATRNFKITYPYQKQSEIDRLKNSFDLKELNATYLEKVTLLVACRSEQADNFWERLQRMSHGGIEAEQRGSGIITMG